MLLFSFSDTFSVDLDRCQQLGRVHGWTSWHWLWAAGVYPSGRHDICQIVTTVCFIFVPQAFLVLLSYIQLITPACSYGIDHPLPGNVSFLFGHLSFPTSPVHQSDGRAAEAPGHEKVDQGDEEAREGGKISMR